LDKPRFLPINDRVEVEESLSSKIVNNLKSKGHDVKTSKNPHGGGQIVSIDWKEGKLIGASDPRKDGIALGY
jgi:gamma-glutamyltranspeptidase/glutathione hydrolase